MSDVFIIVGCL